MFESYAQNSEDIVLWRALNSVDAGTYVDVGAADPDDDSVTKAFYERGWSGLNIEPAPDYAERLAQARPRDVLVQACAGPSSGSIVLHHVAGTGLSSVVGEATTFESPEYVVDDIEVPMRRLDEILHEAGLMPTQDIHFLKIDVEGFEESVIRGIDLATWRPWIIVAESTKPRSTEQTHHEWEPLLLAQDYEFCLFDGLNRFYLATEHAELRDLLSFPAGVFDQPYLTPPHAKLMREYHLLAEGNERLQQVYDNALESYEALIVELDRTTAAHADLEDAHERTLVAHAGLEKTHHDTVDAYQRLETTYHETVDAYQRLETTYHETVDAYQRLETTYHEAIDSYQLLEAAHLALCADHEQLVVEQHESASAIVALRDGVARMGEELDGIRAELDGIRAERDAARQELVLTRQTLSWRITRPLRAARRLRRG